VDRPESDADLVRRALSGHRPALAVLLTRHRDTAVFLAARVLGSREIAADAVQEAAIAAMTDLDRLRSPDRFGAWFCGITLNIARRWLRQLRYELPGGPPDSASPLPGPAELAEAADVAASVRTAIAALPDGQRDAIRLFYLQGLSHREAAAELGISPGAVKARLHQARVALAPRLVHVTDHPEGPPMPQPATTEWADVDVREIRVEPGADPWLRKYVMVLAERDGDRTLPIWIGPAEAIALALTLQATETPRPFTYKLAASLVEAANAEVTEVRITRIIDGVFYASVVVSGHGGEREADARPSDAVNLAVVTGAPIRVSADLFDQVPPPQYAEELGAFPVATAEIAAEAIQRLQERLSERP
jgi:RNA polymerase sigma factor (sigma-70 family)